jgi:hypothetical protein
MSAATQHNLASFVAFAVLDPPVRYSLVGIDSQLLGNRKSYLLSFLFAKRACDAAKKGDSVCGAK